METINQFFLYVFSATPGRAFAYYTVVIGCIVVLLALAIGIKIYSRKIGKEDKSFRKTFRGYPSKLIFLAVLFTLYLMARYSYIGFFSMRLMLYILSAFTIYTLYNIGKDYVKIYPEEKKRRIEREKLNQYIPKQKKGKK